MELFPLAFIVVIFLGVWGSMLISARLKALSAEHGSDDGRLEELHEATRLLESRVERLEEEASFFRELAAGDQVPKVPRTTE